MRQISIDAITEAAQHVYKAAVRTPLIKLDLPFASTDGPTPEVYLKLENAATDWLVQDSRCLQRDPSACAVLSSPSGCVDGERQATPRKAWRSPRAGGRACSVMVMDTAP